LQRSAQEAGLDAGNLRNLEDITKPKLFPDYEWHSSGIQGHVNTTNTLSSSEESSALPAVPVPATSSTTPPVAAKRSASTIYLINKSRELHHRFQNSPFYVRPTQEVDVVRYGKRPCPMEPDILVLEHSGKTVDPRYVPEELLQQTGISQLSMKEMMAEDPDAPKRQKTLEEMAAEELQIRRQAAAEAEEGGDLSDGIEQEDEGEEEDADYAANHYDSDVESDGGGGDGDEATF
jgi:hypothetical protein